MFGENLNLLDDAGRKLLGVFLRKAPKPPGAGDKVKVHQETDNEAADHLKLNWDRTTWHTRTRKRKAVQARQLNWDQELGLGRGELAVGQRALLVQRDAKPEFGRDARALDRLLQRRRLHDHAVDRIGECNLTLTFVVYRSRASRSPERRGPVPTLGAYESTVYLSPWHRPRVLPLSPSTSARTLGQRPYACGHLQAQGGAMGTLVVAGVPAPSGRHPGAGIWIAVLDTNEAQAHLLAVQRRFCVPNLDGTSVMFGTDVFVRGVED